MLNFKPELSQDLHVNSTSPFTNHIKDAESVIITARVPTLFWAFLSPHRLKYAFLMMVRNKMVSAIFREWESRTQA